jgi:hypothetical protein
MKLLKLAYCAVNCHTAMQRTNRKLTKYKQKFVAHRWLPKLALYRDHKTYLEQNSKCDVYILPVVYHSGDSKISESMLLILHL